MKKSKTFLVCATLSGSVLFSSCIGSFGLWNSLGIKEQMNTITNSYNKWLYLFHILVAKITRKTEITKKGVWLCSLFSLVPIYLPSYF